MKRTALLLPVMSLFISGCFWKDLFPVIRPQIEEAEPKESVQTIGDISTCDNLDQVPLQGVGVVRGLRGNGGPIPPGELRSIVEERLRRDRVENISEVLDSPDCAIVLVTTVVKAGARKGDEVDVEVSLPPGSKAKSLRGGILDPTPLANYSTTEDVRQHLKDNDVELGELRVNRSLKGHDVAIARGPLQSSLNEKIQPTPYGELHQKRGFVWRGAKLLQGRAVFLVLNTEEHRFRVAQLVAQRINETFHASEGNHGKLASARHKDQVAFNVPPRYRLNHPHFIRVLRAIPLDQPATDSAYLEKLSEQMQNPATASSAAIRLEALGSMGVPILKAALKSQYPLTRFSAAQSLAYLGNPYCADTLAEVAVSYPPLQAYALTALAALDDAAGIVKLEELLSDSRPEVRYGAFRAIREVEPNLPAVKGTWIGRAFALHLVASTGPSIVHLLSEGRAEIALFGATPELNAPFSIKVGQDITVIARPGDDRVTVSRFPLGGAGEPIHLQASKKLVDVLVRLAEVGGVYSDAVEFINKASATKSLSADLYVDAMPKAVPVAKLAVAVREDPYLELAESLLKETEDQVDELWRR